MRAGGAAQDVNLSRGVIGAGMRNAFDGVMAPERLRLRLPERCLRCGVPGMVRLESTITGTSVYLAWCCNACGFDWPISEREQELVDRRLSGIDRRRSARGDRRQKA